MTVSRYRKPGGRRNAHSRSGRLVRPFNQRVTDYLMKKLIAVMIAGLFAVAGAFADEMKKDETKPANTQMKSTDKKTTDKKTTTAKKTTDKKTTDKHADAKKDEAAKK
jgi:hypothetical protein